MRLTATLRPVTRLTGSLGVATITSFGDATAEAADILLGETAYVATGKVTGTYEPLDTSDATALATDILSPKTAYVDGAKITGSSTFDADTSDATAEESDILLGKTAYAGGVGLTGTSTLNADTTDATLTANDMLYGVTGYGADGTKLTGAGAYWQYIRDMAYPSSGVALPSVYVLRAINTTNLGAFFYNSTGVQTITVTVSNSATGIAGCFRACPVVTINFNFTTANVTTPGWLNAFYDATSLVTINGALSFAGCTSAPTDTFKNCTSLLTITIVPSSIKYNLSFAQSPLLSTASLLSIANGLHQPSAPKTLTMHSTSKTNMNAIMVDNNAGVAELGSAMTLTQFITGVKGWTIA